MSLTAQRAQLTVSIARASRLVAPMWPIERFTAVNPLLGLLDKGFDDASAEARRWLGATCHPRARVLQRAVDEGRVAEVDLPAGRTMTDLVGAGTGPSVTGPRTAVERRDLLHGTDVAARVDSEVARWCATLLDTHTSGSDLGVYAGWRELAPHDRRLRRLIPRSSRSLLDDVPDEPDLAVLWALEMLGVSEGGHVEELRGQFARLAGWASYAKWCDEWAGDDPSPRLGMVELLAIRLVADAVCSAHLPDQAEGNSTEGPGSEKELAEALADRADEAELGREVLETLENAFRRDLLARMPIAAHGGQDERRSTSGSPVAAQVVCCIDVRSESLRRHIEASGPYETLGFAGFFATPIQFRPYGANEAYPSAPVLLSPEVEVGERPSAGGHADRALDGRRRRVAGVDSFEHVAHGPLSMFQLAEASGWLTGPVALARTLAPGMVPGPASDGGTDVDVDGFDVESRAVVAETALRTMGLTSDFAPLVVFCGHGSTSAANPHAASLDCGACGGNRGGPNARAAAAICNDAQVRDALRSQGIDISDSTWFVAAEHDTTTDSVVLLDADRAPAAHHDALAELAADLRAAGESNVTERIRRLPGDRDDGDAVRRARARAGDWSQTRPEWGLARNGAFIVAPRSLTEDMDLDGRAFLHSYDPAADVDGAALETILTAPMVVAHWINAQYYFSTVDPRRFGAGDKTLHNPVAGIGVLEGAGGDLRTGLAWQSVGVGEDEHHEPVRLLTVLVAPLDRIDAIIERNTVLQQLFGGSWVHLVARPCDAETWFRRLPDGTWVPEPTATAQEAA